eukprot:4850856-Pleurochrysis_carterae.AAC.2
MGRLQLRASRARLGAACRQRRCVSDCRPRQTIDLRPRFARRPPPTQRFCAVQRARGSLSFPPLGANSATARAEAEACCYCSDARSPVAAEARVRWVRAHCSSSWAPRCRRPPHSPRLLETAEPGMPALSRCRPASAHFPVPCRPAAVLAHAPLPAAA